VRVRSESSRVMKRFSAKKAQRSPGRLSVRLFRNPDGTSRWTKLKQNLRREARRMKGHRVKP
jgi:hypothetical protein